MLGGGGFSGPDSFPIQPVVGGYLTPEGIKGPDLMGAAGDPVLLQRLLDMTRGAGLVGPLSPTLYNPITERFYTGEI